MSILLYFSLVARKNETYRFSFTVDPQLGAQFLPSFSDYVKINATRLVQNSALKKEYPFVRFISVVWLPKLMKHITVHAYAPLYQVNHDKLLLSSGIIIDKQWYHPSFFKHLPVIHVQQEHQASLEQACKHSVQESIYFPSDVFKNYQVHWVDNHTIVLQDAYDDAWRIVCEPEQLEDKKLFTYVIRVKEQLDTQQFFKKNKKTWSTDVRFQKQIIVYENRGGIDHGTSIF